MKSTTALAKPSWYLELITMYLNQWQAHDGDSDQIRNFLDKHQTEPDFIGHLCEFKKWINHAKNPHDIGRNIETVLFPGVSWVTKNPEFARLNNQLDHFINENSPAQSYASTLFSFTCEAASAVSQFAHEHPYQAMAIIILGGSVIAQIAAQKLPEPSNKCDLDTSGNCATQTSTALTLEKICKESPLTPFNIPPGIAIGAANGKIMPRSCVDNSQPQQCQIEKKKFEAHVTDHAQAYKMRTAKEESFNKWDKDFQEQLSFFKKPLSDIELQLIRNIRLLKYIATSAAHALAFGKGNCGEQKALAILKLLEYSLVNGKDLHRIQIVDVSAPNSGNRISDHQYLLLNSKSPDVRIKNDKAAAAKYLRNIPEGTVVCDTWAPSYVDFTKDKSGLYKDGIEWENVTVFTAPEFKDLNKTSKKFRTILCKALIEINQELAKQSGCELKS